MFVVDLHTQKIRKKMPCGIPVAFPVRFVRHRAIVPARLPCRTRNAGDGDGDAATASGAADATATSRRRWEPKKTPPSGSSSGRLLSVLGLLKARLSLKFNRNKLRFELAESLKTHMGSPLKNPLPREGHVVYKLKWGDVSYVGKHACAPNDRYVASGVLVILMWCARGPPTARE